MYCVMEDKWGLREPSGVFRKICAIKNSSTHPPIHCYIHPSTHPPIHPSFCPSIHCLPIHPSFHPSIHSSIHSSFNHSSIITSTHPLFIHPFIPSIHPSFHHPSIIPFIHPLFIHPSIIHPSIFSIFIKDLLCSRNYSRFLELSDESDRQKSLPCCREERGNREQVCK